MGRVNLKYVHAFRSRGRTYYYFRRGRVRIRLPDPDDPAFALRYRELLSERRRPEPAIDTMAGLVKAYRLTPEFQRLRPSTRRNRDYYLDRIVAEHGAKSVILLARRHVIDIRNRLAETPGAANSYVATLSVLMRLAVDLELRTDNPCQGISRLPGGEYQPWPPHVWDAALAAASPMMRLALISLLYSGQRISDVVRMTHNRIVDGAVTVRQRKTGKTVIIPLHEAWAAELARLPRKAPTILYNRTGQPFTTEALQVRWRHLRAHIGAEDYNLHGLRKNACVALAEVGCTAHEIASITGQTLEMVQHYTRAANQKVLARRAIRRWEQSPTATDKNRTKTGKHCPKSGKHAKRRTAKPLK